MTYLGLDTSARSTGLAIITPVSSTPLVLTNIQPGIRREGERLAYIRSEILRLCAGHSIMQACIEGYSFGSTHQAFTLGEVAGVAKATLAELKIPLAIVAPTALKKFVSGNSSAEKPAMSASILAKWSVVVDQNDQADAYGLARVASAFHLGRSAVRSEMEVIHAMKTPAVSQLKPRRGRKGNSL